MRDDWALILGGAECVWDDVEELEEEVLGREWPGLVIATNDAGADWPRRLDHWVSFHPEKFLEVMPPGNTGAWVEERRRNGHPDGAVLWARRAEHIVDRLVEPWDGGSSGLLACVVAHELACTRGVLCGVPMDRRPHYHRGHGGEPWKWADKHWREWETNEDRIQGWVRSMSGRTEVMLGRPTLDWLTREEAA